MSNDIPAKKSKKDKNIIDENDEILSDSDLDEDQNDNKLNGNVRLDDLLLNEEHEDDETNFHEQKLQRAKEYIERNKTKTQCLSNLEHERELDHDGVSDRLRDDVVRRFA